MWWLLLLGMVASVWLAYHHAYGWSVSLPVSAGLLVAGGAALVAYGRIRVEVGPEGLRAGRAVLPLSAVGAVTALDGDDARTARGRDLDPAAYLVIRGYVPAVVRVEVADDTDPVPYWLMSTRRPERLVAVLEAARDEAGAGR